VPNWADDEGRFWWTPPDKEWYGSVQIPHAPVTVKPGCKCPCCVYTRGDPPEKRYIVTYPGGVENSVERLRTLLNRAGDGMATVEEA